MNCLVTRVAGADVARASMPYFTLMCNGCMP